MWFEAVVRDIKFSSPLTLNMRRMAWKIPMLFVLLETFAFLVQDNWKTESGPALPNPDYLRIHTACCRVAHLSGAAKHMNKIIEDLENMQVLSRMARLHISCLLLYNLLVKNMFN